MNQKWIGFSGILVGMSTSALMQTLVATSLPVYLQSSQQAGGESHLATASG